MKLINALCIFLMPLLLLSQTVDPKSTYRTVDNVTLNKKVYTIKVKYTDHDFTLEVCKDSCLPFTQDFSRTIQPTALSSAIIGFVVTELDTTIVQNSISKPEGDNLNQLINKINALIEFDKTELQKTLESIDKFKDEDAAVIVLNDTANFMVNCPTDLELRRYFSEIDTSHNHIGEKLILKNAVVVFFNNKASTISVEAVIDCKYTKQVERIKLQNYKYSIPLRAFNYYDNASKLVRVKYVLIGQAKNGDEIMVHVNDVFDYLNAGEKVEGNFGFSIANQKFRVANGEGESNSYEVIQRRFFDFFTSVLYTDVMGFNTDNSNSLINAQADLLMPLNLGNWAKLTAFKEFKLVANIALNNSFENENRFMGFADDEKVSHFDLLRRNNLNSTISLDVLSYESKGWFSTYSFGYNLGFYRTGFQYTQTDAVAADQITKGQVFSISHGPYLKFEFRPQDNFGADINLFMEEFNINDALILNGRDFREEIIRDEKSNAFLVKHNILNFNTNFYWLTNPGKSTGGVYARVGASYHLPTDALFPQLLVGYATNLTSFVNRFKRTTSSESEANNN